MNHILLVVNDIQTFSRDIWKVKVLVCIASICIIGLHPLSSQTAHEQYVLNKLKEVGEYSILDDSSSYVIDENKMRVPYEVFKGKWLLIDFWSTGCVPCIKEFPALQRFYADYKDRINVIAVSVDKSFKRYRKSAKKYKIGVPHYYGGFSYDNPLFNLNIRCFKGDNGKLNFRTMTPQYVLVSPSGKIVSKGFLRPSHSNFISRLEQILSEEE